MLYRIILTHIPEPNFIHFFIFGPLMQVCVHGRTVCEASYIISFVNFCFVSWHTIIKFQHSVYRWWKDMSAINKQIKQSVVSDGTPNYFFYNNYLNYKNFFFDANRYLSFKVLGNNVKIIRRPCVCMYIRALLNVI